MSYAILRCEKNIQWLRWYAVGLLVATLAWGLLITQIGDEIALDPATAVPAISSWSWSWKDLGMDYFMLLLIPLQLSMSLLFLLPLRYRIADHELALPISYRDLVTTRAFGVFLSIAIPVLVIMLASLPFLEGKAPLAAHLLFGLTGIASGLLFAGLTFRWRPRRVSLSVFEIILLAVLGIAIAAVPIVLRLAWLWPFYLVAGTACFIGIRSRAGLGIPDLPVQDTSVSKQRLSLRLGTKQGQGLFAPLTLTLLRSTLLRPQGIMALIALVFIMSIAGIGKNYTLYVYFGVFFPWQYGRTAIHVLRGLDPLPIPRRKILGYAVFPPLVSLFLGSVMAGMFEQPQHFAWDLISPSVRVDTASARRIGDDGEYRLRVEVPAQLWELHLGDEPLEIVSPWGEGIEAETHPFYPGSTLVAYNPYDVAATSSPRFLAWQLARAHERATGVPRPAEDFEEIITRVNAENSNGAQAERVEDLRLRTCSSLHDEGRALAGEMAFLQRPFCEYRHEPDPAPTLPVANLSWNQAVLVTLVWLGVMTFLLRPNQPPRTRSEWKGRIIRRSVILTVVIGLLVSVFVLDNMDPVPFKTLGAIVHRSIDTALGSHAAIWMFLVVLLIGASWHWLAYRIERIEVPPPAKMGWNRKELGVF